MAELRVTLEVLRSDHEYHVEMSYGGQMFGWRSFPTVGEAEEFAARGREDWDLYEALRQYGGEYVMVLAGLHHMGMARFPQLEPLFRKYEEERFAEVTEEENRAAAEAWDRVMEEDWAFVWGPGDVRWSPEAQRDREIYHRKYGYDELMAMRAEDVREIARVKGVPAEGRKEDVARRVHQFDYGEEEVRRALSEVGRMLGWE
jgi:hypothetical protein